MNKQISITIEVTKLIQHVTTFIANQITITYQTKTITLIVYQDNVIIPLQYGQHLIPLQLLQ